MRRKRPQRRREGGGALEVPSSQLPTGAPRALSGLRLRRQRPALRHPQRAWGGLGERPEQRGRVRGAPRKAGAEGGAGARSGVQSWAGPCRWSRSRRAAHAHSSFHAAPLTFHLQGTLPSWRLGALPSLRARSAAGPGVGWALAAPRRHGGAGLAAKA